MASESAHDRLPSADAAWLHMDRPTNLMVINSVMLFDERLDEERLREVIRKRLVEGRAASGRSQSGPVVCC